MITAIISRLVILVFGTLYPAYASYKTVKSKNLKEYVKWMMYWIVFAIFTCIETITDIFLCWFPFYYEIKIVIVVWLLSPATKGATFLYRKFVHPILSNREQEIDEYISKAKEQSYKQVLDIGSKGVNVLMQTALKGGGGLVNQIKKSYSLSDLSQRQDEDTIDETDLALQQNLIAVTRLRKSPRNIPASSASMYFAEVDVRTEGIVSIQSAEDLSSGYSSTNELIPQHVGKLVQVKEPITRIGSLKTKPTRVTRAAVISPSRKPSEVLESAVQSSSSDEEFLDSCQDDESGNDNNCNEPTVNQLDAQTLETTNKNTETVIELPIATGEDNLTKQNDQNEESEIKNPIRGGKYHKLAAPEPPAPIKATLILQPGVIKPIGDDQVFCHSPKLRRKMRKSLSPKLDRKLSPKLAKKTDQPMMAKIMGLFKHEDSNKRRSWHGNSSSDD